MFYNVFKNNCRILIHINVWKQDRETTASGDDFVIYQDDEMIVLATARNMDILEASDTLYMDGTFKSAPRIFSQLYSIHGVSYRRVVPLVYCLLADKSHATYYKMFRILKVSFIPLTNCTNSLNVPLHTANSCADVIMNTPVVLIYVNIYWHYIDSAQPSVFGSFNNSVTSER